MLKTPAYRYFRTLLPPARGVMLTNEILREEAARVTVKRLQATIMATVPDPTDNLFVGCSWIFYHQQYREAAHRCNGTEQNRRFANQNSHFERRHHQQCYFSCDTGKENVSRINPCLCCPRPTNQKDKQNKTHSLEFWPKLKPYKTDSSLEWNIFKDKK